MIEIGYERVSLHGVFRWWLFVHLEGEIGRPQRPRRGVRDRGFYFSRGGVAATEDEVRAELATARDVARAEWQVWQHQPSHLLGAAGELVPLDEVLPELTA